MGKRALSALLSALIALPMYYMFYSMFKNGFEAEPFFVALGIAVVTFVGTILIATLVAQNVRRQKAAA
jgi:hypothetical protein